MTAAVRFIIECGMVGAYFYGLCWVLPLIHAVFFA
jgi:hypothetical protein